MKEELMGDFSEEERLKVWSAAAEAVKVHHDELVAHWKEEMDTLLVYVSAAILDERDRPLRAAAISNNLCFRHATGRFDIRHPNGIQRTVLSNATT